MNDFKTKYLRGIKIDLGKEVLQPNAFWYLYDPGCGDMWTDIFFQAVCETRDKPETTAAETSALTDLVTHIEKRVIVDPYPDPKTFTQFMGNARDKSRFEQTLRGLSEPTLNTLKKSVHRQRRAAERANKRILAVIGENGSSKDLRDDPGD